MTELLPTRQAADLRRAITDYVTTAISLADPSVATALDAFLEDEDAGIFLGPYLRTRLPFAAAAGEEEARRLVSSLPAGFTPYAHQAQAFARLTTVPEVSGEQDELGFRLPQPTIVTTGTGSGKTESFLFPMLDHVARARRAGVGGMKALILYPMNALANDQAGRLAKAITENPEYQGISAALYTGEASAQPSTIVSAKGLITDREMIRGSVPDIVLTNYKMLDQLLLRRADRPLWDASGASLRYLVLDEFHTYDGAQGTDVGMLLRRLAMVLETSAPGRVHLTPVATSATLGDGADAADAMLEFASTVFGTDIGPDAVITESRVPLDEFVAPAEHAVTAAGGDRPLLVPATLVDAAMTGATAKHLVPGSDLDAEALTRDVLDALWRSEADPDASATELAGRHGIGSRELLLAHPKVRDLLQATARAVALDELARIAFPAITNDQAAQEFTTALLAVLSHERAREDAPRNSFPNLEAHLWLREITRVDRVVAAAPSFRWSDTVTEDGDLALPAIYCRHCGRSGWGATTRAVGDDLDLTPDRIRKDSAEKKGRFRALILDISSAGEAEDRTTAEASRRRHLNLHSATLDLHGPTADDHEASTIRVLAHASLDADQQSNAQACPACEEKDAIRFLGTRLATLLSVSLTSLFGTPGLDLREKKALVFVDSVQDAAHRAGFVESRSHTLTFRSVIHSALTEQPEPLEQIVQRMTESATIDEQRYRLLHPTITDSERLKAFWHQDVGRRQGHTAARRRAAEGLVRARLQFDLGLEMGLTGQVGRTLLLTGSAQAQVRATDGELDQLSERVLGELPLLLGEENVDQDRAARRRWIRGVLERLRTHGAISHPWLEPFRKEGGPLFRLWGGRPEQDVMPAFPSGRALPQLPSVGARGKTCEFDDATGRASWYTDWTARVLGRDRGVASTFVRPLLDALAELEILDVVDAKSSAPLRSFALRPERIEACLPPQGTSGQTPSLTCDDCRDTVTGTAAALAQLDGGPCLRHRCTGHLRPRSIDATYYRSLYQGDMRRVVAREHTSLLTTEDRLDYETSFKTSAETPGSPNVLVATPTLEMGIDIGDLSTVLLASVPRTVASYLQRVGRAGRQTGNALDVTFVAGRGRTAGVFYDPLDLLNGSVRAPGAYLSAEEILRRQFLASLMDTLAGDDRITPPGRTTPVLATAAPGSFLGNVLAEMDTRGSDHVERFLNRFATGTHAWDGLTQQAAEALRAWALPTGDGSSELAGAVQNAVNRWNASREELRRRRARIQENLDKLETVPSTEERDQAKAALQAEDLLISAEQDAIGADPALSDEERDKERRRLRGSAGRLGAEVSA
ncbi:MAG: DEAD/DEAH box helicase, partial [Brachybacterium tyrofermentans]